MAVKKESKESTKTKALNQALKDIEKQYGKGSIMKLGDRPALDVDVISSGSVLLDEALGIGGYPRGRIIEIYGPEASGKTTFALHAIAEAQKEKGVAAFIDAEHALDPVYAKALGVNIDELILSQPDTGEQGLEITEALIKSGAVDIVVIDSVAALVPEAEINGDMGASHVGLQARLMSQAMRKLSGVINRTNVVVIFINQLREKVGVVYGNPEVTPGGRALKYYSTIRMEIRRGETLKQGTELLGSKAKVKIVKNKVAPPFKIIETDIIYGKGISKVGEIVDLGAKLDIINKSGSWYAYEENKIGQGRENVKTFLINNPDILTKIEKQIKEKRLKQD